MKFNAILDHPLSWFVSQSAGFLEEHFRWLTPKAVTKAPAGENAGSFALAMLAGGPADPILFAEWMRAEDSLTANQGNGLRIGAPLSH